MDLFDTFLESLKREDNIDIIESFQRGYEYLLEAEAKEEAKKEAKKEENPIIDKKYLLSLTADEQGEVDGSKLKAAKKQAKALLLKEGFDTLFKNKEQSNVFIGAINFLSKFILQGEPLNETHVLYLHDLFGQRNAKKEVFRLLQDPEISKEELDNIVEKYNAEKEKESRGNLSEEEFKEYMMVKVLHEFDDGWKWVMLLDEKGNPKSKCSIEAKQMIHCSTTTPNEMLYSLRKGPKSAVTVAVNKDTHEIAQSKGRTNTKVNLQTYGKYMIWLFKSDLIKGLNDQGYKPHDNIHVSDFLAIDPKIVEYFEQNKPGMISEKYDKKVLDIKRKQAAGEINDEQIMELFKNGELSLGIVRGILGNDKFKQLVPESLILEWVKNNRLKFIDIVQIDTKLFTDDVQKELVLQSSSNYKHFKLLQQEVPTFKLNQSLDLWQVIATHGRSLADMTPEQQLELINKNLEELNLKLLERFPNAYNHFDPDVRVTIYNKYPKQFFNIVHATKGMVVNQLTPKAQIDLINKHTNELSKLLQEFPDAYSYFSEEARVTIFNTHPKLFINILHATEGEIITALSVKEQLNIINRHTELPKLLEEFPNVYKYFKADVKFTLFDTYPKILFNTLKISPVIFAGLEPYNRLRLFIDHKNVFSELLKIHPSIIKYIDGHDRLQLFKSYIDVFANRLENNISDIKYFPLEQRKEIFDTYQMDDKYKDIFKRAFVNNRNAIEYFAREDRVGIINTYPELFQEFDPKSLKKIPKAQRMNALTDHPDVFDRFFAENPAIIGLFEKNDRITIITSIDFKGSFNRGFKKDISAINYFPNEKDQIEIFKMYKDSILGYLNENPEEIDYFSDNIQAKLIKHYNIAA